MRKLGEQLESVVVVLSAGRVGNMALTHTLNACFDGVEALHEPRPSWRLRIASNRHMAKVDEGDDEMAATLFRLRRRRLDRVRESVYVESNGFLNGFLHVLPRVFTRLKVLHLVRDPRTYVASALNFGARSGVKRLSSDFVPYWILKPEHVGEHPSRRWRRMNDIERFCWFWNATNRHLERGEPFLGERYRRVRFEDLMARDGQGIRSVASWIGLRERPGTIETLIAVPRNESRVTKVRSFAEWRAEDRDFLWRECGERMRRYGYDAGADRSPPRPEDTALPDPPEKGANSRAKGTS